MSSNESDIITSPSKAIRAKCIDCMGGQWGEVKVCPCDDCPLWPFRFGKNPFSKRGKNLTEEQKEAAKTRLAKARKAKKTK